MTNRIARKLIYAVIESNKDRFNDDTLEALEMGRVALEQPTVCDIEQIRAEIEHERFNHIESRYDKGYDDAITDILKLIDKYTK